LPISITSALLGVLVTPMAEYKVIAWEVKIYEKNIKAQSEEEAQLIAKNIGISDIWDDVYIEETGIEILQ